MPIVSMSFDKDSSLFLRELLRRQIDFASRPKIGYKIVVPDDLRWW